MKPIRLTVMLLLASSLGACSTAGGPGAMHASWTQKEIAEKASNLGPTNTSRLEQSPASCAPGAADPIWGPYNQELLGFSCRQPQETGG